MLTLFFAIPPLAQAHSATAAEDDLAAEYDIHQSMPLSPRETGVNGALQILQDKRVTPEYRKAWGMSADPYMAMYGDTPFIQSIEAKPLRNGRFRLVGADGRIIFDEELEAPLGEIKQEFLYGTTFPTYLVSVDLGVGFGSYAGPATMFVEIRKGKVLHIQTTKDAGGGKKRLWLANSLNHAWRIVPAPHGQKKEIQQVLCDPNFVNPNWADTGEFVVLYATYRFTHKTWRRASRQKIGIWNAEHDWPGRAEFP
jgi:hypothetical protein